ncbi:MAG: class I SAM-dependent methyltransferase family protein [Candidatus Nezhaarchaeota archaeon]|nr:class I SAM-dependent methyltransferase family protein [Candidatus Nezhaarchaeota archaeon]MCX8141733.1 class I SAM-dependent methyltransferase family protein [Candidatus Nezhaarchaeota archaeon]MDW8050489.1 class I SAM-dependent methyltransferase family protein [Nitrososphaerota archaeon]
MRKALALVVEKNRGEAVRRYLASIDALDFGLKIKVSNDKIHIPLSRALSRNEEEKLREICYFVLKEEEFDEIPRTPKTIIEWLSDKLPPHLLASIPKSWDIIGDIAIVELPDELLRHEELVAKAILSVHRNVKSVYAKVGAVEGDFRIRPLKLIGGEDKSVTIHKEHGAKLYVDVRGVFFSPRLSTERIRITSQVRDGESILDMFSGVGPFAIQVALKRKVLVYAIELNPIAYECLVKNISLNRLQGKVIPFFGDARKVVDEHLRGKVDRVIMNLPERSLDYIGDALKALRNKGILHVYVFEDEPQTTLKAKEKVLAKIEENKWVTLNVPYVGFVKQIAPRRWQMVVDVEVHHP